MEEVKVMMISNLDNNSMNVTYPQDPITTTTCSSWKLYENPFYNSQHHHHHQQHCQSNTGKHLLHHHLQLPLSARKIAASFWDLTFFRAVMETELDFARAQILELKAELEYERKARKKLETVSKRLAEELAEERRGREALERACEELAREISSDRAEIDDMKKEMEEERKMLRMAEILREERVQMKLAEAKMLFEEKLLGLMDQNSTARIERTNREDHKEPEIISPPSKAAAAAAVLSGKFHRLVLSEKSQSCCDNISIVSSSSKTVQRSKASPEPENPHIKRGIKGFVEFPRVVRAIGSKNRQWGTKLECQKAQLRILLKQRSPVRSNSLIIS